MRLQLLKIDHGDGTIDLIWQVGRTQYTRTVNASDIDTNAKLGAYILSQMAEMESAQTYILEAHQDNGVWALDSFTGDEDRDGGRSSIRQLPGWSSWSAQQAVDWIDTNITDLASAKTGMKALARMVIYLRDSVL